MGKPSEDSQQPESKWLTIDDFEYVCFDFTRERFAFQEPIPDYSTRNNALLESSLGSPNQSFDKKLLYPTLAKQAAVLFYSLIKNHPFKNGNKRIAVMACLVFLSLNNKWLAISPLALYKLACEVSKSDPNVRKKIMAQIENLVSKHLVSKTR